jgi:hypothetical protein
MSRKERTPMVDVQVRDLLDTLGTLVGGKWVGEQKDENGNPKIEWVYEWSPDRRVLKGTGVIFGSSFESRMGWDPEEERIYYLDIHGPEAIYFGYLTKEDDEFVIDFEAIVGPLGIFRSRGRFENEDLYRSMIQSVEDGIAIDRHEIKLHRIR